MKRKVMIRRIKMECEKLREKHGFDGVYYLPWTSGISIKSKDDDGKEIRHIKYFRYPEDALDYVLNYGFKEVKEDGKKENKQSILQSR